MQNEIIDFSELDEELKKELYLNEIDDCLNELMSDEDMQEIDKKLSEVFSDENMKQLNAELDEMQREIEKELHD